MLSSRDVTVIIATKDRETGLRSTLQSLRQQLSPVAQTVIVDDGSHYDVSAVVSEFSDLQITLLRNDVSEGPGSARNRGCVHAAGKFLAFIDDDVVADPHWLESHLEALAGERNVVSIGPLLAPPDWKPTPWNRWEAATIAHEYERMIRGDYKPTFRQLFTGNAVVPRALFEAAGGFDPRFRRAEDVELGIRIEGAGATFRFTPEAKGWHYSYRTLAAWQSIPRQYAFYDRVIDAMHRPGWLEDLEAERRNRNRVANVFYRAASTPLVGPIASSSAIWTGIGLSRGITMRAGQRMLTLGWLGAYMHALNTSKREQSQDEIRRTFQAPLRGNHVDAMSTWP